MRTFEITIRGTTPLLQHRFGEKEEGEVQKNTRRVEVRDEDPRNAAERVSYRMPGTNQLYLPGAAIGRLLREAGGGHKQKGSRKSIKYIIPCSTLVMDEMIPLINGDGKSPAMDFEVDSRPVTIPATKGRIMRHRPRLNTWSAKFSLRVNEDLIDPNLVQQLLGEGGQQLGVGDFRPERGGPFGTFLIDEYREIDKIDGDGKKAAKKK
jgi:hypothetical protein